MCLMQYMEVIASVFLLGLQQQYGRILSQLRIMYTVGYSLSLGALLLALGILISFRYYMQAIERRKGWRKKGEISEARFRKE